MHIFFWHTPMSVQNWLQNPFLCSKRAVDRSNYQLCLINPNLFYYNIFHPDAECEEVHNGRNCKKAAICVRQDTLCMCSYNLVSIHNIPPYHNNPRKQPYLSLKIYSFILNTYIYRGILFLYHARLLFDSTQLPFQKPF